MCHYLSTTKGHYTHETEGPCSLHSNISHWLQKAETVQVHFTLEGLHGFFHDKTWIVFEGMAEFASSPPPRGRLDLGGFTSISFQTASKKM